MMLQLRLVPMPTFPRLKVCMRVAALKTKDQTCWTEPSRALKTGLVVTPHKAKLATTVASRNRLEVQCETELRVATKAE